MTFHKLGILVAVALSSVAPAWSHAGDPAASDFTATFEGNGRYPTPLGNTEHVSGPTPSRQAAYAGLGLRQNAEGVIVVGVQPGPFGGDGFKSTSIWRGDLIVSMNGKSLDVEGYMRLIRSLAPGDTLEVAYRRGSAPDPYAAVPLGDPSGEERSVTVVLDDAAKWRGSIGKGLAPGRVVSAAEPGEFEDLVLAQADAVGLRAWPRGADALLASLASLQQHILDPNSVPAVVHGFQRPLSLDRVEADLAAQVRPLAEPQELQQTLLAVHRLVLRTLGLADLESRSEVPRQLAAAREQYRELAIGLLRGVRDGSLTTDPQFPNYLRLIRASPALIPLSVATLPAVARRTAQLEKLAHVASTAPEQIPPDLAERVGAAVEGEVLAVRVVDGELWVVGGKSTNRYDMSRIAAVYDVGGDDVYSFSSPVSGYQIIIDQSGDDLYESGADFAGPAAALFSVSVLEDRGGNDRYVSHGQGSIAAGVFGVAILIDRSGNDRYINDTRGAGWAEGIGVYGAGMLIDRAGDDRYEAQVLAQGVGGPGGVGLLVDGSGNDTYTANGPYFPSSYGTPGVYVGWSQGLGLGLRGYAAGGVGALYDLAGDDRYSVGEFGQGTGYFQGLGILHDAAGNDRYLGSRYAQGSAAHQAAGLLVDDAGDDSYECPGPASQGAAWDQSIAMLIDRAGDDSYSAGGLAQGSAAEEAVGVLIDLDGRDVHSCANTCLGESGDNAYHYEADAVFNFGVMIDLGGKIDAYPPARSNNELINTGTLGQDPPASARCCGLFYDH